MTDKNIHQIIAKGIDESSWADGDDITKAVLAALDKAGYVIVPAEEWSNATAPVHMTDPDAEKLRQALRESNAMNRAAVEALSRFSHRDSIPRDALKTAMRQAYEDALRDEIGQHGEIAGRLS